MDREGRAQLGPPSQERDLHDEGEADRLHLQRSRQRQRRHGGPARRDHVVRDQDARAGLDQIAMGLDGSLAVLQREFLARHGARQLARLAREQKPGVPSRGQSRGHQEPSRLDPQHRVGRRRVEGPRQRFERTGPCGAVGPERRQVPKENALLGKIGDRADERGERRHGDFSHPGSRSSRSCPRARAGLRPETPRPRARS